MGDSVAKAESSKGRRLGTVDTPPERPGGDVRPLPPVAGAAALLVATLVATFAAFAWFLSRHEPRAGWGLLAAGLVACWLETRYVPGLRERSALRRARRDGRRLVKGVRAALKKQGSWLSVDAKAKLEDGLRTLEAAIPTADLAAIEFAQKKLDEAADAHLTRKAAGREYAEQIGGAIIAALLIRAFFYEAFKIPTGSMVPTLLVGDHLFVNKFTYGLRVPFSTRKFFTELPERGDIVVFDRPGDEGGDAIIKRVVGLPGDVVEVENRRISVNGKDFETRPLAEVRLNGDGDSDQVTDDGSFRTHVLFEEKVGEHVHVAAETEGAPQGEAWGNEGRWVVKPGHVFVMGDNRDNSQDSRFGPEQRGFGQIPVNYIKGRADVIWLSVGGPHGLRFGRMFSLIE